MVDDADRAPALGRAAFRCPHCDAHTSHTWHELFAKRLAKDAAPRMPAADQFDSPADFPNLEHAQYHVIRDSMIEWRDRKRLGAPFFSVRSTSPYIDFEVENLSISTCFVCDKLAVWVGDRIAFPPTRGGPISSPDMPADIARDFDEARSILDLSPRGAAAMLRLAVQKLCKELGEPGKDLNTDIGSLVAKGLPTQIQQALDAVRVIGNESVHPGELDMRDDRETAETLFALVNLVVDDRITRPKILASTYAMIPAKKLQGIAKRDTPNGA